jgi:hypothetical protein
MARGTPVPEGTLIQLPNGYYNRKTAEGWKLVQRAVMEEHLGRELEPNERVYFINKNADKSDPKVEDLEIRIIKKKEKKPEFIISGDRTSALKHLRTVLEELEDLLSNETEATGS